jgi:transcriptional regulator with XRE-family HTH domain
MRKKGARKKKHLRELREAGGLTQKQAAEICGVDVRTFQRWEHGVTAKVRPVFFEELQRAISDSNSVEEQEIRTAYEAGTPPTKLADRYNRTETEIRRIIKKK